jgi:hypothetical protein
LDLPYTEKNYYLPESVVVTQDNWIGGIRDEIRGTYPPSLPFPNVPYLRDGEEFVSESRAIMRYIARKYGPGLLGDNPSIQTRVDMLENFLWNLLGWFMNIRYVY